MKKILILSFIVVSITILISGKNKPLDGKAFAPMDTVKLLNASFNGEQWAWFVGAAIEDGSANLPPRLKRKLRTMIQADASPTWSEQYVLDTLPGRVAIWMYQKYMDAPAGIAERIGTTFRTKMRAVTNDVFLAERQAIDAKKFDSSFNRVRAIGAAEIVDQ